MTDSPYVHRETGGTSYTTTGAAYLEFVRAARLRPLIAAQIRRLREGADVVAVGAFIRTAFFDAQVAPNLAEAITLEYVALGGPEAALFVSCLAADEPLDEFLTGPQELFVQVKGNHTLLSACKRCWGSAFTDRAITYREGQGIDHLSVTPRVGIELMPVSAPDREPVLISSEG
ncbi:PEP/pyruvate-binding domain-containing protein [Kribbella antibiotica]|nr:PEP/pyruvate-binding domain-containing protein [Kribbella antibiotica]